MHNLSFFFPPAVASDFNFFILLKDLAPKTYQKYRIVAQCVDGDALINDWNEIMSVVMPKIKEKEVDGRSSALLLLCVLRCVMCAFRVI